MNTVNQDLVEVCKQCPIRTSPNCATCVLAEPPKSDCLVCEGSGKQTCTSQELTSEGWKILPTVELNCIWCEGSGKQTPAQAQEVVDYRNAWCKCSAEVKNNQDNHIYQENRHSIDVICGTCEKYIQVG